MKYSSLAKTINERLENEHLKHVQMLPYRHDDHLGFKFTSVDTPKLKERVKALCDDYCESLSLVKETPTTLCYII